MLKGTDHAELVYMGMMRTELKILNGVRRIAKHTGG